MKLTDEVLELLEANDKIEYAKVKPKMFITINFAPDRLQVAGEVVKKDGKSIVLIINDAGEQLEIKKKEINLITRNKRLIFGSGE
jgi:hypothetical protein